MPIYFMSGSKLPIWVLKRIDRIRRAFLWGKRETNRRGVSLINWEAVCSPIQWGGMGMQDLQLHNIALLIRWWWRAYTNPDCLWTVIITKISWTGIYAEGPDFWSVLGTFFWKNWLQIFAAVYEMYNLDCGERGKHILVQPLARNTSYWYLRGRAEAKTTKNIPERCNPNKAKSSWWSHGSWKCAFHNTKGQYAWKWTTQGLYTASSIYKILVGAGKIGPQWYSSGSFAYRPLFGSSYSYCSKRRYWHRMWWGVGTWVQTWAVRSVCNAL